jgi:outer membrane receptor protein involved in Fe transport
MLLAFIAIALFSLKVYAGTTGKLSGKIIDAETKEPVVGANVILEGTYLGAAADLDGYFFVSNIPPGKYRVIVTAVGYQKTIIENVAIKIDLTTNLDVELNSTVLSVGEEVVVRAERPLVQKDLTSTSATVSAEDIKMMPVENLSNLVNLQAGVIDGHFRGGRSNEVAYLIDGIPVNDAYNNSRSVEVENASIRQMEVISGTFNAEYGQAMSGIVNIVTQDGSQKYEGSVSAYVGNYTTNNDHIFENLDDPAAIAAKNYQFNFSGPVPFIKNLTFFTTGRYYSDEGYLYGKRVYNVWDTRPIEVGIDENSNKIYWPVYSGDGSYVSMNPSDKYSFNGKVTYSLPKVKFSYSMFYDDNWNKYYNHGYKWTPDAIKNHYRKNAINTFQITHVPSNSTFQTLQFASNFNRYYGYLYEDPYDPRYVDPTQGTPLSSYTFNSGGNEGDRYERSTRTNIIKWSLNSQITKEHKIGIGAESKIYTLYNHSMSLYAVTGADSTTHLEYPALGLLLDNASNTGYTRKPFEFAAYIQDKMEYDIMIINVGVRFDYFEPNSKIPYDLRNVTHNPLFPDPYTLVDAKAKYQVSPRIGASFPITDRGAIHFSYGHFFQMPSFENLFSNPDMIVRKSGDLQDVLGNPDLKPQKTVMYEIGLQQSLLNNLAFDFTVYYRDINNLLGTEIVNTYDGFRYGRFVNVDYGNVRGLITTFEKTFSDYFGVKVDYTYQISEANSSDPYTEYNNAQSNVPSEKKVVPTNWDQRSTLNISLNVGEPGNWTAGMLFQYGSGMPYTEDLEYITGLLYPNGQTRPTYINVDLRAEKSFKLYGLNLNVFALIYNLFDIKNETGVYANSGRAGTDLNTNRPYNIIGLNTIEEYVNNPTMYSTPRQIRLGVSAGF